MSASMQTVKAGWMQRQSDVFKRWKKQYCVLYLDGGFSYFSEESRRNSEGSLHLPSSLNFIKVGVEVLNATAPSDRTISCLLELQTSSGSLFFCADSGDDAEAWKAAMVEVKNMNVRGRTNQAQQPPGITAPPPPYAPQPPQTHQAQPKPAYPPPNQPQPGYPTGVHPPTAQPPTAQPQAPPAYPTQQGAAPGYYAPPPTQQVVTTTVYPTGRRRCRYPRQTTVYSYPGQTYYGAGPNTATTIYQANGQTTTVYPNPYQQGQTTVIVEENRNRNGDAAAGFVAGAAVGSLMVAPLLFW